MRAGHARWSRGPFSRDTVDRGRQSHACGWNEVHAGRQPYAEAIARKWMYLESLKGPDVWALEAPGVRVSSARAYRIPDDGIATSLYGASPGPHCRTVTLLFELLITYHIPGEGRQTAKSVLPSPS
jgi:hypothetical protein